MTYIQHIDGELIDLDALGIRTRDFIVSAPTPEHTTEKVVGSKGLIDMGSTLGAREITVQFKMTSADSTDFGMLRDEVFNLLRSDRVFYLIEKRNAGKRWLVKVSDAYQMTQRHVYGDFDVVFTANSGVAESIGTTRDSMEWDSDAWQWNIGIEFDENLQYEHNSNNFTVHNLGTETINPRDVGTQCLIEIVASTNNHIEIENTTTGDIFRYDGNLTNSDTLRLDGIRATKNSLSVYRNTNKNVITLKPGANTFEVRGATVERILFDLRFYFV